MALVRGGGNGIDDTPKPQRSNIDNIGAAAETKTLSYTVTLFSVIGIHKQRAVREMDRNSRKVRQPHTDSGARSITGRPHQDIQGRRPYAGY